MPRTFPLVIILILLLPLAAWSADTVTFRFAPPDGTTFVQTVVTTKARDMGANGGPELQIKKMTITGGGERLIDPATMLIYSETLERTTNMEGMGVSTEKREYTFDYEPAAKP